MLPSVACYTCALLFVYFVKHRAFITLEFSGALSCSTLRRSFAIITKALIGFAGKHNSFESKTNKEDKPALLLAKPIKKAAFYSFIKLPLLSNFNPGAVTLPAASGSSLLCSTWWQVLHKASKLLKFNVIFTSLMFSGVIYILWWTISAVRPQRSHI